MSDSDYNFGGAAQRSQVDAEDVLDQYDDVAVALIDYIRGNVIKNEPQGLLLFFGWLSGWFAQEERYVNEVVIGSSSGGKTHLVRKLKKLIASRLYYEATSGSDKSFVDDQDWNGTLAAILSEWQKLPNDIKEFMKSVAGDDGGYTYSRSVPDPDGPKGARKTEKKEKESKPYSFTFAQFSMDNEMWNRLFKNYIDESQMINRAVARMHAGHEHITMDGEFDREYIYDTDELRHALQKYIRDIPRNAHVYMPEWVFYAVEPCLNLSRAESKRSSAMVFNLIRSSALFNHRNRDTTTIEVDGEDVEAFVVEPQDVANVLSCQRVLLGTTHELEPRKMEVVDAVRAKTKMGEDAVCLLEDIQAYFNSEKSDMSTLKKDQLREILRELEENFIIKIHERYEGNAHGYEFLSLSQIGHPLISGYEEFEYNDDEPFMGVEKPSNPFKDCIDPITGVSFKESVEEFRSELKESEGERVAASNAMSGRPDSDDTDDAHDSNGQSTLGTLDDDEEPHLDGPVELTVYDWVRRNGDGESFPIDGLENLHVMGIVDVGESTIDVDPGGTPLDPDHGVWDQPDESDDWVTSQSEAEAELDRAYSALQRKGIINYVQEDQDTIRVKLRDVE